MNRSDVSQVMATAVKVPKSLAEQALNAALEAMSEELRNGGRVTLAGFGTFRKVARNARTGRDPRTGSPMRIEPRNSIAFSPGSDLKALINPTAAPIAAAAGSADSAG